MAGILSWQNWRNLIVEKGKGKGGPPPNDGSLYAPIEGQRVLPFVEMSNRVMTLSRDYEERVTQKKKEEESVQRKKDVADELHRLGITPPRTDGKGKGPGSPGSPPAKRPRGAGLSELANDEDFDESAGTTAITEVDQNEAFLCVGTVEKICRKLSVTIILDAKEKQKPISLSEAADSIKLHDAFNHTTWDKKRRELFGLGSRTTGKKQEDHALICSVLAGFLGKHAHQL